MFRLCSAIACSALLAISSMASADPITTYEGCLNIDGNVYDADAGVFCSVGNFVTSENSSGSFTDGLGGISVTATDEGAHFVSLYLDFEIGDFISGRSDYLGATNLQAIQVRNVYSCPVT
jgi:hypothetical protein